MNLTLSRLAQDDVATLGHIESAEHEVLCVTLELPWRDNQHDVSCIPAGVYQCRRALHHGKYEVWELEDVPNRDRVHVHIGNSVKDTEGCVLVGSAYGPNHTITESGLAFKRLMQRTSAAGRLTLSITEAWCEAKPEQAA